MQATPPRRAFRFPASQAILFAPVALLALTGLLMARNACSRPIIVCQEAPGGDREAFIRLEYPPAYPFTGDVRAVLEVRRLPGRTTVLDREVGRQRWAGSAIEEFGTIEWDGEDRIILRARDGLRSASIRFDRADVDRTVP